MIKINITEATISKLSLSPGDKLVLIIKDGTLDDEVYKNARIHLQNKFPDNEILVFVGDIEMKVVQN